MVIAGVVIGFCLLVLVLAFLFPRLSRYPEHGGERALGFGGREAGRAPGPLGRWLRKPFSSSQRAVARSGRAGRRGRSKMPM